MAKFRFEVWPSEHRRITQHFGARPEFYAKFGLPGHEGVDIQAPVGGKIFCVAPGTVHAVQRDLKHPYGLHVRVDHDQKYQTIYAHLSATNLSPGSNARGRRPDRAGGRDGQRPRRPSAPHPQAARHNLPQLPQQHHRSHALRDALAGSALGRSRLPPRHGAGRHDRAARCDGGGNLVVEKHRLQHLGRRLRARARRRQVAGRAGPCAAAPSAAQR